MWKSAFRLLFSFNKNGIFAIYFILLKNYIAQKGYISLNKIFFHFSIAFTFSVSAFENHFNSSPNENGLFFSISLISFLWKERQRCLERQYAFRLLENSYVIVFAKTSSHKILLNVFLNICNIQLQGRREVAQKSSQDEQTPFGNAISKVKIFSCEGSKPLEYDPKGMRSIILSRGSKSKLETKA